MMRSRNREPEVGHSVLAIGSLLTSNCLCEGDGPQRRVYIWDPRISRVLSCCGTISGRSETSEARAGRSFRTDRWRSASLKISWDKRDADLRGEARLAGAGITSITAVSSALTSHVQIECRSKVELPDAVPGSPCAISGTLCGHADVSNSACRASHDK